MPVKPVRRQGGKTNTTSRARASAAQPVAPQPKQSTEYDFGKKILLTLLGVLLAYATVFLGTLIRNNLKDYYHIGQADKLQRTIRVEATGTVTAQPDIAVTTIGMIAEGDTVGEAQQKNTSVMNALIERLKEMNIAAEDIQTANYNIYPRYQYSEEDGRLLDGYEVSQSVTVKIRDLSNANAVLALAGDVGANSVSGLDFTIDDREVYLAQARDEALGRIAKKARTLAQSLGVRVVSVVSYDEFPAQEQPLYARSLSLEGFGGVAPQVESGSMDVSVNASVVFEIR